MHEPLTERLTEYLDIQTNYAVIINGEYGIGKTHYVKTELIPHLEQLKDESNTMRFKPVHVSLFGMKSVEDIQLGVLRSSLPHSDSKGFKAASAIGSMLVNGVMNGLSIGSIDDLQTHTAKLTGLLANFDKLVIILDDLDRKAEELQISNLFGYINSLVENHGAKIILLANVRKLNKGDRSSDLWEKVIGVNIQFRQDQSLVYDQIVESRYTEYPDYSAFLTTHKELILDVVKQEKDNLRNLIFFLEHFRVIHEGFRQHVSDESTKNGRLDEKMVGCMKFTIAICMEYKTGKLNPDNFDELEDGQELSVEEIDFSQILSNQNTSSETESQPTFVDAFKEKYFPNGDYVYLESIFNYIIGVSPLNVALLEKELSKHFVTENGEVPEYEIVYQKLAYMHCLELGSGEYRKTVHKMLQFVDVGAYQLKNYTSLFHFATRLSNPLGFDLDKLLERFINGIKKGAKNYDYTVHLDMYTTPSATAEFRDYLVRISKFVVSINEELGKEESQEKVIALSEKLFEDFDKFIESVKEDGEHKYTAYLKEFNIEKTYRAIHNMSVRELWILADYLDSRYSKGVANLIHEEKEFLVSLTQRINKPKHRTKKNWRNAVIDRLVKIISEHVANVP